MTRKLLLSFLLLLLAACTAQPTALPTPLPEQIDSEEQAVYAALIQALFPASLQVIMDTTATNPGGTGDTAQTLAYVLANMHGVSAQTSDSFLARNTSRSLAFRPANLGVPYVLFTQDEVNSLFSTNQDGWQLFYGKYPDARGILTLSRAGFDTALDQALVYAGMLSQFYGSSGRYVLLNKVNGTWTIDQKVTTWHS